MPKILIVEDVDLNIDLLVQLLEGEADLLVARDGQAGIRLAEAEQPDMILMDMSLPIITGWEATRYIRDALPDVVIIGVSAHAMDGDRERALQAGCDDYLTKPIDDSLLFAMLKKYL